MNEKEQQMLLNLHKKSWLEGLTLEDYKKHADSNEGTVKEMLGLTQQYNKCLEDEDKMTSSLRAMLLVLVELHDLCHDKSLLKISMNSASSLRSFCPFLNSPCLDLIWSSSEEILELQSFVALDNYFI